MKEKQQRRTFSILLRGDTVFWEKNMVYRGKYLDNIAETYLTSVPATVSIASTQEDLSDRLEKEQVSENYIFQILIA